MATRLLRNGLFAPVLLLGISGLCAQQAQLAKYPLGSVTGNGSGWIDTQLSRSASQMGSRLAEFEYSICKSPLWDRTHDSYFVSGRYLSGDMAAGYYGEFSGKYLLGQVYTAYTSGNASLQATVAEWVDHIVTALPEASGYIGSYSLSENRHNDYHGYAGAWELMALMAFYEANPGRTDVLDACRGGVLWFVNNFLPTDVSGYVGQDVIQPVLEVYRHFPADTQLLGWSNRVMDRLNSGNNYPISVPSLLSATFPSMHGVAYGYAVRIPALIGCHDAAKTTYRAATINGLEKVIAAGFHETGAPATPGEGLNGNPASNDETETCDLQVWAEDFALMAGITGEGKWGDRLEKIVYNASQACRKKDEKASTYYSGPNKSSGSFGPNDDIPCCPIASMGILPEFVSNMFMHDRDGNVYAVAYGPVKLKTDGTDLLTEITNYPFDKNVVMTLNKPFAQTVKLRIPAWSEGLVAVSVNGSEVAGAKTPGTYLTVTKSGGWVAGDVIRVTFDRMDNVSVVRKSYSDGEHVMIERGPLLFSTNIPVTWSIVRDPVGGALCVHTPPHDMPWYSISAGANTGFFLPGSDAAIAASAQVVASAPSGYVWENPPVKVRIPLNGTTTTADLIPYGCTNISQSNFPVTGTGAPVVVTTADPPTPPAPGVGHVGVDSVGANQDTPGSSYIHAVRATAGQNVTATSLNLYIERGATGSAILGICTDISGCPDTLLAQTGEIALANGWTTGSIPAVDLSSGTDYWLVFVLSQTGSVLRYFPAGTLRYGSHAFGALPPAWPSVGPDVTASYAFYAGGSVTTTALAPRRGVGAAWAGTDNVGNVVVRNMPSGTSPGSPCVISVADVSGRQVRHLRITQTADGSGGGATVRLPGGALPAGCYVVRVTSGGRALFCGRTLVRR